MTALTADYEAARKDGLLVAVPVLANAIIFKGALVVDKGTGFASAGADASGAIFLGVADEGADATGVADGAKEVRVWKTGSFLFPLLGGATQTNLTNRVMVKDDQTVATASTNSVACGYIVSVEGATNVRVRIDRDVA